MKFCKCQRILDLHSPGLLICSMISVDLVEFLKTRLKDLKKAKNIRTGTWRKPGFWSLW